MTICDVTFLWQRDIPHALGQLSTRQLAERRGVVNMVKQQEL